MKFSLELLPNEPIDDMLDLIKTSEDIGFDNVWITDHYNNKNVFEILALAAYETSTIKVGTGVSNPFMRNPVTIASATTTLDEISNGRALVGIGPGDKATMETLGITWNKPVATVKNCVETIRKLTNGEKLDTGAKLDGTKKVQDSIPIYVGAQGPRMLEAAGQVADGVLINASNPKDFEFAIPLVNKGLENNPISKNDYSIAAYTACSIDNDMDVAVNQAKIVVAFIIAGSPEVVLNRHGISVDSANQIKEYLANHDFKNAIGAVTDDMVDAFSVCGRPKEIMEKIEELKNIGVNEFVVGSPIGKNKVESLKLLEDVVNSFN